MEEKLTVKKLREYLQNLESDGKGNYIIKSDEYNSSYDAPNYEVDDKEKYYGKLVRLGFVEQWNDETLKVDDDYNVYSFYDDRKHWLGYTYPLVG